MGRIILAGTFWLMVVVQLLVASMSVRNDLRYGANAVEGVAEVNRHLLGTAVLLQPGLAYTSLELRLVTPGGIAEYAEVHGVVEPPAVGTRLRVRYPPGEPTALRIIGSELERFRESLEATAFFLLVLALAVAATRGCRDDAPPRWRYTPTLVVGLGIGLLGLVSVGDDFANTRLVEAQYRKTATTVVRVEQCRRWRGRASGYVMRWCTQVQFSAQGREHIIAGPDFAEAPRIGTTMMARVHPQRSNFVLFGGADSLSVPLGLGLIFLLVGGTTSVMAVRFWLRARRGATTTLPSRTGPVRAVS
jgi:hypothetical protein